MKMKGIAMIAMLIAGAAQAQVIVSYTGYADPRDGAWNASYGTGSAPADINVWGNSNVPAWVVSDGSHSAFANYSYTLDAMEKAAMTNLGWKLTVDVAVQWERLAFGDAVMTQLTTSDGGYRLRFGRHNGYSPVVEVLSWDGSWYVMGSYVDGDESITEPLYRKHELVYDPATQTLDLFIDGVERLSNMESSRHGPVGGTLTWGSGSAGNTGEGRFKEVTLETATNIVVASSSSGRYMMAMEVSSSNAPPVYQVQSSSSLVVPDWVDSGTFVQGKTNTVVDLPDTDEKYYRVLKSY